VFSAFNCITVIPAVGGIILLFSAPTPVTVSMVGDRTSAAQLNPILHSAFFFFGEHYGKGKRKEL